MMMNNTFSKSFYLFLIDCDTKSQKWICVIDRKSSLEGIAPSTVTGARGGRGCGHKYAKLRSHVFSDRGFVYSMTPICFRLPFPNSYLHDT